MLQYETDWNEYVNCRVEHPEHIPFVHPKDFKEWIANSFDKHDKHSSEVSQELIDFLLGIMGGDSE